MMQGAVPEFETTTIDFLFMSAISGHGHLDTGISFDTVIVLFYIWGYEKIQTFDC